MIHFFHFEDGRPLTKALFVQQVREVIGQASMDPASYYSGHSFRIGAATWQPKEGSPTQVFRLLAVGPVQLSLTICVLQEATWQNSHRP